MQELLTDPGFLAGVETAVLLPSLLVVAWLPKQRYLRIALLLAVVLLSLALHAMLLVLPVMLLYGGIILMTGHLLCRFLCKKYASEPLAVIPIGIAAIILLVALCSLVRLGTPERLRVVMAVLLLLELVACRKKIVSWVRARKTEMQREGRPAFWDALMLSAIVFAVLVQAGRAGISLDYDSLWYGLRSDAMLAPFTGIYDKVVATGLVYSYSKGIEALSLAFCFDATYSFVQGVNLLLGGTVLYTAYRTVRLFAEKRLSLFVALCLAVTPGIMNMTVTAKSDIATLLCQLLFAYFALHGLKMKDGDSLCFALAVAMLSLCFKSSAIIFTTVAVLVAAVLALFQRVRFRLCGLRYLILPALANVALMARTFLLTGMPLTQMGAGIFEALGFFYKFPYAPASSGYVMPLSELLTAEGLRARLPRLLKFFFAPVGEEMGHVAIAWGGILFAVAFILVVLLAFCRPKQTVMRIREDKMYAFMLISTAAVSAVGLGSVLLLNKPDGNYYMLMYALTFICLAMEVKARGKCVGKGVAFGLTPLVAFGVFLVLYTNWAGSLGFTPPDKYNKIGYYDHAAQEKDLYEEIGLAEIADRLKAEGGRRRVMLFASDAPALLSIPAIAESCLDLSHWGNSALYESVEGLVSYFDAAGVEYLVLERDFLAWNTETAARLQALEEQGHLYTEIEGDRYLLIRYLAARGCAE